MNPSNISIHIEKAIFHVSPENLPLPKIIDLSASSQIRTEGGERFTTALDGSAVMDHKTGLMWAAEESDNLPWEESDRFCKSFSLGGFTDWFLASDEQMLTIVDRKLYKPCLPKIFKTHSEAVWTSTQTAWSIADARTGDSRSFWCVYMGNGGVYNNYAHYEFRARPVRVAAPAGQ
jgi:hypothetical protein